MVRGLGLSASTGYGSRSNASTNQGFRLNASTIYGFRLNPSTIQGFRRNAWTKSGLLVECLNSSPSDLRSHEAKSTSACSYPKKLGDERRHMESAQWTNNAPAPLKTGADAPPERVRTLKCSFGIACTRFLFLAVVYESPRSEHIVGIEKNVRAV